MHMTTLVKIMVLFFKGRRIDSLPVKIRMPIKTTNPITHLTKITKGGSRFIYLPAGPLILIQSVARATNT